MNFSVYEIIPIFYSREVEKASKSDVLKLNGIFGINFVPTYALLPRNRRLETRMDILSLLMETL